MVYDIAANFYNISATLLPDDWIDIRSIVPLQQEPTGILNLVSTSRIARKGDINVLPQSSPPQCMGESKSTRNLRRTLELVAQHLLLLARPLDRLLSRPRHCSIELLLAESELLVLPSG